jgi:hypothetical protein
VVRQVIADALAICLNEGITEEVNADGYVSLTLSAFPSESRLDTIFAIGVLSAMHLLRLGYGPDPISPALLEVVFNGFDSLIDPSWLSVLSAETAQDIALLPLQHGMVFSQAVADRQKLGWLLQSRMRCTMSLSLVSSLCLTLTHNSLLAIPQISDIEAAPASVWPKIMKSFYVSTLLNAEPDVLESSTEFKAFRDGLNVNICASAPSLIQVGLSFLSLSHLFIIYL